MLYIDFESRSTASIWDAGAYVYAFAKDTEVLCLAYAMDDDQVQLWIPGMPTPSVFLDAVLNGALFEAHNVFFERCIWKAIMTPMFGFPEIPKELWRCSMAQCSAMGMPRALDKAAEALQVVEQKDKEGAVVMRRLAKSCDIPYATLVVTHDTDLKRLYEYCKQDVRTEREISRKLPPLSDTELKVWQLDQDINMHGVQVDTVAVDNALPIIKTFTEDTNKDLFNLTNGAVSSVTQRDGMLRWMRTRGMLDVDKLTKLQVQEWLAGTLPPEVRSALCMRMELGKTSVAKYDVFKSATSPDGRLRDILVYCGAGATGRWAGKLVQLQNLPADRTGKFNIYEACRILQESPEDFPVFYPSVAEALSFCLRGMIIAAPGHDLIVADYATIEVRVLAWLANEAGLLDSFHHGRDVYIEMASRIFNRPMTKNDKPERQLGKQAVLGCGYGMGVIKFEATCKTYGMNIDAALADKAVSTYRSTYPGIPRYWREINDLFLATLKTGRVGWSRDKKIGMGLYRDWLLVKLPSGRHLSYYKPVLVGKDITYRTVNSVTRQWESVKTYGGKLVENITQATARDIMAAAMLRCEPAGYPLVLSVHDELVAEPVKEFGSVDDFVRIITTIPSWAKGCPIKAEGWRGDRYKK